LVSSLFAAERKFEMNMSLKSIALFGCAALSVSGMAFAASGAAVPITAKISQVLLEQAYVRTVATGEAQRPWASTDMVPIGKITMPRLGISEIILDGGAQSVTKEAMRAGPTWMPNSAAIGTPGTSVIAAHRDTHFAFLKHIRVGDVIEAAGKDGAARSYRVTSMQIVDADKFTIVNGQAQNELALSTCYPFGSVRGGTQRYVVHAALDASPNPAAE
jgi:sortase A